MASVSLSQGADLLCGQPCPPPPQPRTLPSSLPWNSEAPPPLTSYFSFSLEPQSHHPRQVSCPTFSCKGLSSGDPACQSGLLACPPPMAGLAQTQRRGRREMGASGPREQ